jgi:hypothetical protein
MYTSANNCRNPEILVRFTNHGAVPSISFCQRTVKGVQSGTARLHLSSNCGSNEANVKPFPKLENGFSELSIVPVSLGRHAVNQHVL